MSYSPLSASEAATVPPFVKTEDSSARAEEAPVLAESQIEEFERDGFVCVPQITTREEAAEIREILVDLFDRRVGVKQGAQFDLLHPESTEAMTLLQLTNPCDFAPQLIKTQYMRNAHALARQVLGPRAIRTADFVIMKPARSGSPTPWHQDEAYRNAKYQFREITVWMPLQEVDANSGCMQFVPGTHKGQLYDHHSPNNDLKAHSLECSVVPDEKDIVSCPLRPGDCSIHDGRVLHGTPANHSDTARYAYILVFQTPPVAAPEARPHKWLLEKQNADKLRRERWFRRGGFLIVAWHKFRRGDFSSFDGIKLGIQRSIKHFKRS